jgi:hypothetical protein
MKKINHLFLFLLLYTASCKNKKSNPSEAENNIDAARNFIRAALDGKFDEARNYMLQDSMNINYMDVAERSFQKADKATKDGYKTSSINIHQVIETIQDSVTIVIFSNSFKNDPDTLRVIKTAGKWLVDLKYLYEHSADTMHVNNNNTLQ